MKKQSKRDLLNLFFSAFLIIGYVVCVFFLNSMISSFTGDLVAGIINIAATVIFGLLLFYATRVGDGKQVRRFSLPTLILVDIPALFVILASLIPVFPFNEELAASGTGMNLVVMLACVALGYGLPYTFLSGYELKTEEAEESAPQSEEEADTAFTTLDYSLEDSEEETSYEEETAAETVTEDGDSKGE